MRVDCIGGNDCIATVGGTVGAVSTAAAATTSVETGTFSEPRTYHPAILNNVNEFAAIMRRVAIFLSLAVLLSSFVALGGCSVTEHYDGGGYTVRYASASNGYSSPEMEQPPRRVVRRPVYVSPRSEVVVKSTPKHVANSHPILNVGQDDEIPSEYAKFVSDRNIRTWRARARMCRDARPGYCSAPNIPHCHGPFCHAHPGGNRRHTH